jgi:general secretion pathway protein D
MRYEIRRHPDVLPDSPEWRNYKVDYVNIARSTASSVNIATQISTTGGGGASSNPVQASQRSQQPAGNTVGNRPKPEQPIGTAKQRPAATAPITPPRW